MVIKSKILSRISGIQHGFGTFDQPLPSLPNWDEKRPQWKQVHGVQVGYVTSAQQACGEVDALVCKTAEIPIGIVTADCVPVLLCRNDGTAVASVHAGWRGTHAKILHVLFDQLRAQGENPHDWSAAIGPSIGPCCYEVSEELAQDFSKTFAHLGTVAVPSFRKLDLPAINAAELQALGVKSVDLIRACTRCSTSPLFHSYRREGKGTRQWSVIGSYSR